MSNALLRATFLLILASQIVACSTIPEHERSILEYKCNDIVVVGRVKIIDYTLDHPDAELKGLGPWYAKWDMEVAIKRVIYGNESRKSVRATSVSHGRMRDDLDFVLVLKPIDDGYEMKTGNLVRLRPKPVPIETCNE